MTYRVYDYNRVDKNGKKRELHFNKAIQVTKGFAFSVIDTSFQVLMCLDGYGEVQTMDSDQKPVRFGKGETLFLPAGLGRCLVVGDAELIKVRC